MCPRKGGRGVVVVKRIVRDERDIIYIQTEERRQRGGMVGGRCGGGVRERFGIVKGELKGSV